MPNAKRSANIPVVSRRLYFSNFYPLDNERLHYTNLYTTVGGGFEYFLAKTRGRLGLYSCLGPCGEVVNVGTEKFTQQWLDWVKGTYRDGIAMDEWGQFWPEACEAIKRVGRQRGDRMVVPWLCVKCDSTVADAFKDVDLVLDEMYVGWRQCHHDYRRLLGENIDAARKHGLLEKWVFALNMMDGTVEYSHIEAPTLEQREREVQYLRMRGPEMPGVAFYGGYQPWGPNTLTRQTDELCYKYFIAPVVTFDGPWEVQGDSLRPTVRNIGGMTAKNVVLAAMDGDQQELGRAEVPMLRPGEKATVAIRLPRAINYPAVTVLPGPGYTELNPHVLVVMPTRQMRGLPVHVCWTPLHENQKLAASDRLEFRSLERGSIDFQIADPGGKGTWDSGTLHLGGLNTAQLTPGRYAVRIVDGRNGHTRTSQVLTITAPNAKFYVSKVNSEPWTGNPQEVAIRPGDTFEVRWDMGDWKLSGGAGVYVSEPGDPLEITLADAGNAVARIHRVRALMKNIADDAFVAGQWTWSSRCNPGDSRPLSADLQRINMAERPGRWRLWIGEGDEGDSPGKPISVVPVITVSCGQTSGMAVETQPAASPAASRVANPNRVARNPGFETLGPDNMPIGWTVWVNKEVVSVATGNGCHGKNCVYFKLDGKLTSFALDQFFPVTRGRGYILSAMVKTRNLQMKSPCGILVTNPGWAWGSPPLEIPAGTSDWKQYSVTFRIPVDIKDNACRVTMYWKG
ncbi:MAG: hypothetical protein HY343_04235, partial [Lentisphaerae bacterium]|nr:hypothetical protein [Lentisphaerota bacterium]